MKQGDLFQTTFRHKLTGQRLTLKRDYGELVSCYTDEEPEYDYRTGTYLPPIVICHKSNLTHE